MVARTQLDEGDLTCLLVSVVFVDETLDLAGDEPADRRRTTGGYDLCLLDRLLIELKR